MSDSSTCPVCNTTAKVLRREDAGNDIHWECQRCGTFRVLGSAAGPLGRLKPEHKAKLSGWTFEQNTLESVPRLTRDVLARVMTRRFPSINERSDRLLLEALRGQTTLGAPFNINEPRFVAATYSRDTHEVAFLLRMLSERGLMQTTAIGGRCEVLPEGYVAADTLARSPGDSNKGFVAMSFSEQLEQAYRDGLQAGIHNAGYDPVRVDRVEHTNRIDDEIIAQIRTAFFVVADFTEHRGGVYFEAGFALGLNLPVIWTCHKDAMTSSIPSF